MRMEMHEWFFKGAECKVWDYKLTDWEARLVRFTQGLEDNSEPRGSYRLELWLIDDEDRVLVWNWSREGDED